MLGLTVGLCVAMMVVCALVRGFTTRKLSELKRELSRLQVEEGRAKEDRGRVEIQLESLEARTNNVKFEIEKASSELQDMAEMIAEIERKRPREEDGLEQL